MDKNSVIKKVEKIYTGVISQLSEKSRVGAYDEPTLYEKLTGSIHLRLSTFVFQKQEDAKHLAASIGKPVERIAKGCYYCILLHFTMLNEFQEWNASYRGDMQFTDDEQKFMLEKISAFLFEGDSPDPPMWMSKVSALIAMHSALKAFDQANDISRPGSYESALYRAFKVLTPHIRSSDQESMFEMFAMTYPTSATVMKREGRIVKTRERGEYSETYYMDNKNSDEDRPH